MTQTTLSTQTQVSQLQACLSQARELAKHGEASQAFTQLRDRIGATDAAAATLLDLLWTEVLAARRSATFWQEICDVEKQLSDRIAANHVQLRQNYLRLMQEQ